jgi:hypothetical protein
VYDIAHARTVCRFDVPTFVGQKIDQEAKEKLITETATNIDHAHFVQEMSYCSLEPIFGRHGAF